MKTLIQIAIVCFIVTTIISCSKKKGPEPRPQGYFVKTIQCTFPASSADRNSSFTYDEKNRIKEFRFSFSAHIFNALFQYNDLDLITRIDQTRTSNTTGAITESKLEFRYAGRILSEYALAGTFELTTYNAAANSYNVGERTYTLDAENYIKRIDIGTSNRMLVNYLSSPGLFTNPIQNQIAMYIFGYDSFIYYQDDIYYWSGKELGSTIQFGTNYTYNVVRDDHGNMVQLDVKNATGGLYKRFTYTYELRDLE